MQSITQPPFSIFELKQEDENYIGEHLLKGISKSSTPYYVDGDLIGFPFSLKGIIFKYGKEIIPSKLGIYHLFYDDRLVYVGMSKNIRSRLLYHIKFKTMPFDNVLWFVSEIANLDLEQTLILESKMIKKLMPPLNTMHFQKK